MKKYYLFRALALLALLTCAAGASAENANFSYHGIYYCLTTYDNGTGVVSVENNGSFNTYSGTVNIPDSVPYQGKYYPVTCIGFQAFKDCTGLTVVTLPEGVEMLLNESFAGCTSLRHITLPSTVYTIYNNAFIGCTNLDWITCLSETAVSCNTNNFDAATYASTRLYVPQGSLSSYQSTSAWSQFANIVEDNLFVVDGIYYKRISSNTVAVTYRDVDLYSYHCKWYRIPSQVTYNGVTYTVTQIDSYAFSGSKPIRGNIDVTLPNSVTIIGTNAFSDSYIRSIELDKGVTSIGAHAFEGCDRLLYFSILAETPPAIASNTFPSAICENEDFMLVVPRESLAAYRSANNWNNFIAENVWYQSDFEVNDICYQKTSPTTVEVSPQFTRSDSLSSITAKAGYTLAYESVAIPATINVEGTTYDVTSIGYKGCAFWNKKKSITLPNSIKTLEPYAFYGCDSLVNINLPEGLTSIGRYTFYDCWKIETVNIPNSVKTIDEYAYWRCYGIKTLTFGSGVELIGYNAFNSCDEITSVTCHALVPPAVTVPPGNYQVLFSWMVFDNATLHVPQSSLEAYQTAPGWENFYQIETFATLDDALNVPGGTLHFESTGDYPWIVIQEGDDMYAQSGNAGVSSSTSVLTATVTAADGDILDFDFKAWGEGTSTFWDRCSFYINGVEQIAYGAYKNVNWETYSVNLPAGECTLEWRYSKDSSVHPEGDFFAIDNVVIRSSFVRGDVNGNGDVNMDDLTALINYLLTSNSTGINMANAASCDSPSSTTVSMDDLTALINYLLTNTWP